MAKKKKSVAKKVKAEPIVEEVRVEPAPAIEEVGVEPAPVKLMTCEDFSKCCGGSCHAEPKESLLSKVLKFFRLR